MAWRVVGRRAVWTAYGRRPDADAAAVRSALCRCGRLSGDECQRTRTRTAVVAAGRIFELRALALLYTGRHGVRPVS